MKKRSMTGLISLALVSLMSVGQAPARGKAPETPLDAQGEKLMAKYAGMLTELKRDIAAAEPTVDAAKKTAFTAAHAAVTNVPPRPNPNNRKNAPPRYAPGYEAYDEAQKKAVDAAAAILPDAEAFLASDTLDAKLAKCALLAHATPRGLAEFAQKGKAEEALVDELLADDELIMQIMAGGGAFEGKYGQAMQSYKAILRASERAREGFLRRFALANCLENPERQGWKGEMTAEELGVAPGDLDEDAARRGRTPAEVMVDMYLNYEQAYLEGKLDEAFTTLSDFDYRFIFPDYDVEHVTWIREMMRNYRPDQIVDPDYKWRYCRIVKTDVPYTGGLSGRRPLRPDLNLTKFQDFFLEGGICGPRAFVGKLSTAAFGIPTRGARQTGHAAMSRWTPDGWTTVFGAHWTFNSWRGRCGLDFFLETQGRREPGEYLKVLRAQWLGDALDEAAVNPMAYGVGGGLWNALAFYKKLAIVEAAKPVELAPTGEELSESNEAAVPEEAMPLVEMTEADRTIVVGEGGVVTIPPAACVPLANTSRIRFMKTIAGDAVQVHYSLGGGQPEMLKYYVEGIPAGKYALTAQVCTVTVDRSMLLRLNRRTLVDMALPYTKGFWESTNPVTVDVQEGRNTLIFTLTSPNKGVSIRNFKLTPLAGTVPNP